MLCMMARALNPSTWEAETGEFLWFQGQLCLYSNILTLKKIKIIIYTCIFHSYTVLLNFLIIRQNRHKIKGNTLNEQFGGIWHIHSNDQRWLFTSKPFHYPKRRPREQMLPWLPPPHPKVPNLHPYCGLSRFVYFIPVTIEHVGRIWLRPQQIAQAILVMMPVKSPFLSTAG